MGPFIFRPYRREEPPHSHGGAHRAGDRSSGGPRDASVKGSDKPARELIRVTVAKFGWRQPHHAQNLLNPHLRTPALPALKPGDKRYIFPDRIVGKQPAFLDGIANVPPKTDRIPVSGGLAVNANPALAGDE